MFNPLIRRNWKSGCGVAADVKITGEGAALSADFAA
jgi:hypothetical protein